MLVSTKTIYNKILEAIDGEIGRCKDFLFDDRFWAIRYMITDTQKRFPGRKVLISPISIGEPDWESDRLPVQLSKTQIKESPSIEEDLPVSRQYEIAFSQHYGWANYWHGPLTWGSAQNPADLFLESPPRSYPDDKIDADSHHLRSAKEVNGYYIEAGKEFIGKITDFILDEKSWTLRYMVVHSATWLSDKKFLMSPMWVTGIDWSSSKVEVDLSPSQIQNVREYEDSASITREYEDLQFKCRSKKGYWLDGSIEKTTYPEQRPLLKAVKNRMTGGNQLAEKAEEMIEEGNKRINESQLLQKKGEEIISEKTPELKKIKSQINEGKKIVKEAERIIKKGENIVVESGFPKINEGIRNVVTGKRLKKTGETRIKYYEKKLEQTKDWIEAGERFLKKGKKEKTFGEMLKKSGRDLVSSSRQQHSR